MRAQIEGCFKRQTEALAACDSFVGFENGKLSRSQYDDFIANICKTHLKSPQILGFLFSIASPGSIHSVKHNLLEELGMEEGEESHPELLRNLAIAAGFSTERMSELEKQASEETRRFVTGALLYGTIKELGLAIFLEVSAYEWMLSRLSRRMGDALVKHHGLKRESLEWFYHHSEVDIRHAEESLDSIVDYISYYDFSEDEVEAILEVTFRENVFLKRYFGPAA